METDLAITATGNAPAVDLSLWTLFFRADPIVKFVILGLGAASVWSWAIIFNKTAQFRRETRLGSRFERAFWSGRPLDELHHGIGDQPRSAMAAVFVAAMNEWQRSKITGSGVLPGTEDRIERAMDGAIAGQVDILERQLPFLATVGSTAPFIGLFGTVWGIMNSFQAIASSHDTNLAVVAPGIAEALFATALGLLAAIPAVVFYNKISGDLSRQTIRMETLADKLSTIVSRQVVEQATPAVADPDPAA